MKTNKFWDLINDRDDINFYYKRPTTNSKSLIPLSKFRLVPV